MRFDEVWMQPWQTQLLAELAARTNELWGAAIEIGTHQGLSAIPIAKAIRPRDMCVVDHWLGSSDFPPEARRDNYSIFVTNIIEAHATNICVHKEDWREFALRFLGEIRFLHLDAEHTLKEVEDQIAFFMSRHAEGAIIAGDDYGWEEVQTAVRRSFPQPQINVEQNKLWWVQL